MTSPFIECSVLSTSVLEASTVAFASVVAASITCDEVTTTTLNVTDVTASGDVSANTLSAPTIGGDDLTAAVSLSAGDATLTTLKVTQDAQVGKILSCTNVDGSATWENPTGPQKVVDATGGGDYTLLSEALADGAVDIYIKPGVYNEPASFTVNPAGPVRIRGSGGSAIIDFGGAPNSMYIGDNTSPQYVVGPGSITVTRSSAAVVGDGSQDFLTNLPAGSYVIIENLPYRVASVQDANNFTLDKVYYGTTAVYDLTTAYGLGASIHVSDVTFRNSTSANMVIINQRIGVSFENVLVTQGGSSFNGSVYVANCFGVQVEGCRFINNTSTALRFIGGAGVVLSNSVFNDNSSNGITLSSNVTNVQISNCEITHNSFAGLRIDGNSQTICSLSNSRFVSNLASVQILSSSEHRLYATNCIFDLSGSNNQNMQVSNNVSVMSGCILKGGLSINGANTIGGGSIISECIIQDASIGISFFATGDNYATVNNCRFVNCALGLLIQQGASYIGVQNCRFENCDTGIEVIQLGGSSDITLLFITGNFIQCNTAGFGINFIQGGIPSAVTDTHVTNNMIVCTDPGGTPTNDDFGSVTFTNNIIVGPPPP